eukprot:231108-Amphidinium_carterae.1
MPRCRSLRVALQELLAMHGAQRAGNSSKFHMMDSLHTKVQSACKNSHIKVLPEQTPNVKQNKPLPPPWSLGVCGLSVTMSPGKKASNWSARYLYRNDPCIYKPPQQPIPNDKSCTLSILDSSFKPGMRSGTQHTTTSWPCTRRRATSVDMYFSRSSKRRTQRQQHTVYPPNDPPVPAKYKAN